MVKLIQIAAIVWAIFDCFIEKFLNQQENPMYNTYYQWVSIFLIFQSMLFYLPRVMWLMMEGGEDFQHHL
jgi:hypothetical protein